MKRLWFLPLALLAALALAAVACEGEEAGPQATTSPSPVATATPSPGATETPTATTASLQITDPADGATVPSGDVTVTVDVSNFSVVDKLDQPAATGEGHVHFFWLQPNESVPTTPGEPAITAGETYHASATTTYSWPDRQPGTYKVAAELVNNDHTPLEPPVVVEIEVTVQ
ncbi:MAG: hypothetical protein HYS09_07405 [Chloroflexi bacterium]|nr:hypothetical protein [Chloroflexota bacterium]